MKYESVDQVEAAYAADAYGDEVAFIRDILAFAVGAAGRGDWAAAVNAYCVARDTLEDIVDYDITAASDQVNDRVQRARELVDTVPSALWLVKAQEARHEG